MHIRICREPQVRIELTTARLRIGCSTPELLWQVLGLPYPSPPNSSGPDPLKSADTDCELALPDCVCGLRWSALERTRTAMPCGTTPSRWRVYQFHHQGYNQKLAARTTANLFQTGPTGLEPATSRVTVECSNQTELRPQLWSRGRKPLPHFTFPSRTDCQPVLFTAFETRSLLFVFICVPRPASLVPQ